MSGARRKQETPVSASGSALSRARRKGVRLTPYSTSSQDRRRDKGGEVEISAERQPLPPRSSQESSKVVKSLISKTCRVYQLSPLWGFETSARALKMYSEQVTKLLEGKHRARSFVGVVTVVKDFGSEGSFCVMVTVRQRDAAARSPGNGVVLCRMGDQMPMDKVPPGFMYLPLMLAYGQVGITQVLLDWLRDSFDCLYRTAIVDQSCLHTIAAKYATTIPGSASKSKKLPGLSMKYNLPEPVRKAGLTSVALAIPYDSTMALAEDDTLHQTVQELIHTHFHLKLSSMTLVAVSTAIFKIDCNDSSTLTKFSSAPQVIPILCLIQQSL